MSSGKSPNGPSEVIRAMETWRKHLVVKVNAPEKKNPDTKPLAIWHEEEVDDWGLTLLGAALGEEELYKNMYSNLCLQTTA
ncbi:hypothetical protein ROHU_032285 [Labeo rohita]|uniref:Uncharacterized protein n=1 Tax=Labeo rohita TaxID=84645 RepID=A0A498LPS6_LABRO|nr:hypothetical protein ROHU_032285 [Labeo rohita]